MIFGCHIFKKEFFNGPTTTPFEGPSLTVQVIVVFLFILANQISTFPVESNKTLREIQEYHQSSKYPITIRSHSESYENILTAKKPEQKVPYPFQDTNKVTQYSVIDSKMHPFTQVVWEETLNSLPKRM